MLNDLSNKNLFENMELYDENNALFVSPENFSGADGDSRPARNAACHFKCNFKLKKKRGACFQECDRRFPKSAKQDARRDKQAENKEERKERREADEAYDINKRTGKPRKKWFKVGRAILGLDPRILKIGNAPLRAGVIAAFRVNLFGMSIRLYPAMLTDAEVKAQGLDLANAAKARKAWAEVAKMWYGFGGSPTKLKETIKKGSKRKVSKWSDISGKSGFDGEYSNAEAVTTAAIIAASTTVITTVLGMIASSGAKKNPYKAGSTPSGLGLDTDYQTGFGGSVSTEMQKHAQRGVVVNDPNLSQNEKEVMLKAIDEGAFSNNFNPEDWENEILGMKPVVFWTVAGISVVAIGLTVYAVARKN